MPTTANNMSVLPYADSQKIIWPKICDIRFKLGTPHLRRIRRYGVSDPISGGDWDLDRIPIGDSKKIRSVIQRFRDGVDWGETELFRTDYSLRFARGDSPRGCTNIAELKEHYRVHVDALFAHMKENGFLLPEQRGKASNGDLPRVFIARDGEVLFGNAGNHRLAMAMVLGMETVPCTVLMRHVEWQKLREQIHAVDPPARRAVFGLQLAQHPDLADLFPPERISATDAAPGPDSADGEVKLANN